MKKAGKIGLYLLLSTALLTSPTLYSKKTSSPSLHSHMPMVFSLLKEQQWVEKCVERHPELLWLVDNAVAVDNTEKEKESLQVSYSELLFGQKYVEFDRILMAIYCLKLILNGSDDAYFAFTASQPDDMKLSRKSFQLLHLQGQKLLKSKRGRMSKQQMAQTMETALVLSHIGKSKKARKAFQPYNIKVSDPNDFYEKAIQTLIQYPELCPSFAELPNAAKVLLSKIANLADYDHIAHLKSGPKIFNKLKESVIPSKDREALYFDLFIHACNVAGSLGHIDNQSSLAYTEQTHRTLQTMTTAIMILSNPRKKELDAYNAYLSTRALWLGLNLNMSSDRVLARMGTMLQLSTLKEGLILRKALFELESSVCDRIIMQLDMRSEEGLNRTPTYMSAVLVNLFNNPQLGETEEERLYKTIIIGLPFISRVLEKHQELLTTSEERDPNTPLDFNQIAAVAKTMPADLLDKEFYIDQEGIVTFKSPQSWSLFSYLKSN